jgi:hypothetical protein
MDRQYYVDLAKAVMVAVLRTARVFGQAGGSAESLHMDFVLAMACGH